MRRCIVMPGGLQYVKLNVFEASPRIFKVWCIPIATEPKVIFRMIKELSEKRIADSTFLDGYFYFKGDQENVINELQKVAVAVGSSLENISLDLQSLSNKKILKALLYSAFERELNERGWRAPLGKRKRSVPELPSQKEALRQELSNELYVLYGLKYMFDVDSKKNIRLWLDIYSPVWSLSESRPLMKQQINSKIKELYVRRALLSPIQRYNKTLELINTLFNDRYIELRFCDGEKISFSKEMCTVSVDNGSTKSTYSFAGSTIDEPYLRFKLGNSPNPRDVVRLRVFGYGTSVKDLRLKAIVSESTKSALLDFVKNLIGGFSGVYTKWPGFKAVTGTEISFNTDSDIITLDDFSPKNILSEIRYISQESDNKTVVLLVIPSTLGKFYYKIKSDALVRRVPLQLILNDSLKKDPLEFTLINMGISLYAKRGGLPWIPSDSLLQRRGLFIGISFHIDHENKNIYYGVVEVFDKFGKHIKCTIRTYSMPSQIKSIKGLYIPREDAERIIENIVKEYDPREITLHKSAPFHKEEKDAIESVCQRKGISYCLVHIERTNLYRVYNLNKDMTPIRGTIIYDSMNRAILNTTGHAVVGKEKMKKWSGIGTPKPLEINLEINNTQYSISEIAKQILALTKLDWNTTEVSVKLPITLKYSNKAANLAPYLRNDEGEGLPEITDLRFLI
jgi:hypothetical protein